MNYYLILASIFGIINYIKCGPSSYPEAPPPRGLGYQASVSQAKRQLSSFYARDIPVRESISKMEDYYINLEEDGLKNEPHINKLKRKPCKVLPDPQPGLVNSKLVEPVYKYHPIYKNEKFFGEFARPVKFEYVIRSNPPNNQMIHNYQNNQYPNYQYPNNQYPSNQYPNNQYRNNQYPNNIYTPTPQYITANNPFNGYRGQYSANSEYFETETFVPPEVSEITPTSTNTASFNVSTINNASWQSQLSVDYSARLASFSSLLVANSAAISSMSANANLMSISMVWASKEASLKSKLAAYSATATTTRNSWHW